MNSGPKVNRRDGVVDGKTKEGCKEGADCAEERERKRVEEREGNGRNMAS